MAASVVAALVLLLSSNLNSFTASGSWLGPTSIWFVKAGTPHRGACAPPLVAKAATGQRLSRGLAHVFHLCPAVLPHNRAGLEAILGRARLPGCSPPLAVAAFWPLWASRKFWQFRPALFTSANRSFDRQRWVQAACQFPSLGRV